MNSYRALACNYLRNARRQIVTLLVNTAHNRINFIKFNGLSFPLNSQTGVISGTPTVKNMFDFQVMAENSAGSSFQYLSIYIRGERPRIITASLPSGVTGTPYGFTLEAAGSGPFTWTMDYSENMFINSTTGILTGAPVTPGSPRHSGKETITVTVRNSDGEDSKEFELDIDAGIVGAWYVSKIETLDADGNVTGDLDDFGTLYRLFKGYTYHFTVDDVVYPSGESDYSTTYSFSDYTAYGILSFRTGAAGSDMYETVMSDENSMQLVATMTFGGKRVAYLSR